MDLKIDLQTDTIELKATTIVKLYEHFLLTTLDGPFDLKVEITADLGNIPEKYHEVFLNMLSSKYLNKVSFGDNPFSECKPIVKRKWWMFWKAKYFQSN